MSWALTNDEIMDIIYEQNDKAFRDLMDALETNDLAQVRKCGGASFALCELLRIITTADDDKRGYSLKEGIADILGGVIA